MEIIENNDSVNNDINQIRKELSSGHYSIDIFGFNDIISSLTWPEKEKLYAAGIKFLKNEILIRELRVLESAD